MKLFEVIAHYQNLLDKEELTAEDEAELWSYQQNIENFAIQVAAYIKNMEADYLAICNEAELMTNRANAIAKRINSKRTFLTKLLEDNNIEKITKCPWFEIKIRKGREKVDLVDKTIVPNNYYKSSTISALSLTLIADDIKKGIAVPGARMIKENKVEII